MSKKLYVLLLTNRDDSMVGSVTAQTRFKNSIEFLSKEVECLITDIEHADRDVGDRTIHYLMLNEPPIEIQDKHEWYQNYYFELVERLSGKSTHVGLQLHGEHVVSIYDSQYDNYWKRVVGLVNAGIYQITPDLCQATDDLVKNRLGIEISTEYLPTIGINNTSPVISSVTDVDLCYASRIAPRKKPNNFLRLMGLMYKTESPQFCMYGNIAPGIHNVALEGEMANLPWSKESYYRGPFQTNYEGANRYSNPSRNHNVVWGGAQIGKGNNCLMSPRIELAVLEAYQYGTIPILFNETVPDWFDAELYIGIDWLAINHISKIDTMIKAAEYIKEKTEWYSSLSKDDKYDICHRALESVMSNTSVAARLNSFLNKY